MHIQIGTFAELGKTVMPLRRAVFYDEQGIPDGVMDDEHNESAVQCAALEGEMLVATARLAEIDGNYVLGQVVTQKTQRGKGYGKAAVTALLDSARERGITEILVHAQMQATGFYRKLGFIACGEPYYEGNFELIDMKLKISVTSPPVPDPIGDYIKELRKDVQPLMRQVRGAIRKALPDATEKISWQMPTFWQKRNLIHFAAQKNHLGIYPGAEAMEYFAPRLAEYKTSKGAVQFPYKAFGNEQLALIAEIAEWCGKQAEKETVKL
jgi:uncharacterized protein YdhG (YjbR/CyaY superfamily)/predicted GNAT family N-acyltransferase